MSDAFVMDPLEAKEELGVELEDDIYKMSGMLSYDGDERIKSPRTGASRHPGKFMFNASMKIILSFSYPLTKYQDHFECYKELHSELQLLPRQYSNLCLWEGNYIVTGALLQVILQLWQSMKHGQFIQRCQLN